MSLQQILIAQRTRPALKVPARSNDGSMIWRLVSGLAAAGTAMAVRRLLAAFWPGASEAPVNPADRRTSWVEALAWAAVSGLGAGMARTVARRSAAGAWEAATENSPPGIPT